MVLAISACGGSAAPGAKPAAGTLTVRQCTAAGMPARCGTLTVPENRLTGQGRTLAVRFTVLPATGPERSADPVVWFAGGPGDSAVETINGEYPLLQELRPHRDLVFIEQRGTGSSGPLTCPAFPGSADPPALRRSVESCLASLPGDVRYYTTAMFADDVSQVLTALHYGKANLIGGSYGATAEQVFLLRHPAQVRTMTLLSGSLLSVPLLERLPGSTQRALDYVFAQCASQAPCRRAFPRLAAEWAALWSSLGRSPLVIPAALSPAKTEQRVDQAQLASIAYQALYTGNIGRIPVAVHALATARNKVAVMLALEQAYPAEPEAATGNQLMYFSIMCGEPWARERPAALAGQRGSFAYQGDMETARWRQQVCRLIPVSAAAVGDVRQTPSDVPVLALNGAADPIDPPGNMAGARSLWPDSLLITVPGQGHKVSFPDPWNQCGGPQVKALVERASLAGLSGTCPAVPGPSFDLALP